MGRQDLVDGINGWREGCLHWHGSQMERDIVHYPLLTASCRHVIIELDIRYNI